MTQRKRGTAVTGDLFRIEHPTLALDGAFSSYVDVLFDGVTHQVLTMAGVGGFSYANTVGEFAVGDLRGHVVEALDSVATQAVHRHQAILATEHGALSVHGYDGPQRLLSLVGALRPTPGRLGITIDPDDGVEITSSTVVALATDAGLLEITPLTRDTDQALPRWRGTPVAHGDLYAGRLGDDSPYLTLVTRTARAVLMVPASAPIDTATAIMADLAVTWTP